MSPMLHAAAHLKFAPKTRSKLKSKKQCQQKTHVTKHKPTTNKRVSTKTAKLTTTRQQQQKKKKKKKKHQRQQTHSGSSSSCGKKGNAAPAARAMTVLVPQKRKKLLTTEQSCWNRGTAAAAVVASKRRFMRRVARQGGVHQVWNDWYSHVECQECHSAEEEAKMLLCDECDAGFHMHCLRPILVSYPQGKWFCPHCARQRADCATRAFADETKRFSANQASILGYLKIQQPVPLVQVRGQRQQQHQHQKCQRRVKGARGRQRQQQRPSASSTPSCPAALSPTSAAITAIIAGTDADAGKPAKRKRTVATATSDDTPSSRYDCSGTTATASASTTQLTSTTACAGSTATSTTALTRVAHRRHQHFLRPNYFHKVRVSNSVASKNRQCFRVAVPVKDANQRLMQLATIASAMKVNNME